MVVVQLFLYSTVKTTSYTVETKFQYRVLDRATTLFLQCQLGRVATAFIIVPKMQNTHRVSKKRCKFVFGQNFVKFPPILIIFWQKGAKRL